MILNASRFFNGKKGENYFIKEVEHKGKWISRKAYLKKTGRTK